MGAFAKDMKLRFDSGFQQRGVEIDTLIGRSHLIITSVHNEYRTDGARGRVACRASLDDLTVIIAKPWIKQTGEVRHSTDFGYRAFWFEVDRGN